MTWSVGDVWCSSKGSTWRTVHFLPAQLQERSMKCGASRMPVVGVQLEVVMLGRALGPVSQSRI